MKQSEHECPLYRQLDLYDLILICIDSVARKGEDCTFERLVFECFITFPNAFGLFRYPQWPDSNKLDRPLRKLRERGLVVGGHKTGFVLTEDGKYQSSRASNMLQHQVKPKPTTRVLKGKERNFIAYIESSELYQRFRSDKSSFTLDEQEFIDLLRATLETPKQILKQNLAQYKNLAEQLKDSDLQEFLTACEEKMKSLLNYRH
jgi:hypothetical protein